MLSSDVDEDRSKREMEREKRTDEQDSCARDGESKRERLKRGETMQEKKIRDLGLGFFFVLYLCMLGGVDWVSAIKNFQNPQLALPRAGGEIHPYPQKNT
jgi:hypothetical protein